MSSVRRALAISFLERYFTVALALGSNMLLARLLTPNEIGIYSVSLAVIGIAQVLREFGIGNYLIQEKDLTDDHTRTAFGVSLLLGTSLFSLVYFSAPFAAKFYSEPAMTATLRIASINFLILPFCTVRLALLRRAMRFTALMYVSIAATVLSQLTTLLLAWMDFGPNSMAIGSLVLNLAMAVGTFLAHSDKRLLGPSFSHWRTIASFGGQSALTSVVTTVSMDANDLIAGKVLGFAPVAMLSRAQGLMNLFHRDVMGAVRNVALPAFAQAHREGSNVAARFIRSLALVTVAAWPFYAWASLYALEATRLLFGPQWDEAAALVPIFCLAGAIGALTALVPTLLIAIGRVGTVTKVELTIQPLRLLFAIVALLVAPSMQSIAWALVAVGCIAAPVYLIALHRAVPGVLDGLTVAMTKSLLVCLATAAPAAIHVALIDVNRPSPASLLSVACLIAIGGYLGLCTAKRIGHPLVSEPLFQRIYRFV
jgi:O-antigen/teichoic acid export membrane protein